MLIFFLYVDDLIFTSDFGIAEYKAVMESKFQMNDMGIMKFFLGIEVQQSKSVIVRSQWKYASAVLKRFNVSNCKKTPTPVITSLKLSKDDDGSTVDPVMNKNIINEH